MVVIEAADVVSGILEDLTQKSIECAPYYINMPTAIVAHCSYIWYLQNSYTAGNKSRSRTI